MHNSILPVVRSRKLLLPPVRTLVSSALQNGRPAVTRVTAQSRSGDFPEAVQPPAGLDRSIRVRRSHLLLALIVLALGGTAWLLAALVRA